METIYIAPAHGTGAQDPDILATYLYDDFCTHKKTINVQNDELTMDRHNLRLLKLFTSDSVSSFFINFKVYKLVYVFQTI